MARVSMMTLVVISIAFGEFLVLVQPVERTLRRTRRRGTQTRMMRSTVLPLYRSPCPWLDKL